MPVAIVSLGRHLRHVILRTRVTQVTQNYHSYHFISHFDIWRLPYCQKSLSPTILKSSSEDQELSITWAAFQFLSHFVNWKFIKQDKCEGQSISLQVRGFSWLKPTSHLSNRPHVELACRSTGKHRPWPGQDKPNAFIIQCESCRFVITYPRKWKVDHFSINS